MTKDRYNFLIEEPSVIKIGTVGVCYWADVIHDIAVFFWFSHAGVLEQNFGSSKKRIMFSAFPLQNLLEEIRINAIRNPTNTHNTVILVNADMQIYATSYKLIVDPEQQVVRAKLIDMPELGDRLITEEELNGIGVAYNI